MTEIVVWGYLACAFLLFPAAACRWFFGGRRSVVAICVGIVVYSALSWALSNGAIWLRYCLDPATLRGPEAAVALFFGWLYLWFTSLPVLVLWSAFRALRRTVPKA